MMMVLGQVLGELESSELVFGSDPSDNPRALEIHEVPICRAPRDIGELRAYVRDADRMADGGQQLDHRSAATGVALINPTKTHLDEIMQTLVCRRRSQGSISHRFAPPGT
jgi:hypothetical protein